ncbi:MAG: 16S rRNA (cytidine(1402)-2'-O)-methyltransferase, partial [[Clostridium] leptum]
ISVCRELTKKHETIFRTDLEAAIRHYETEAARGECVLVIEGRNREEMEKEKQAAWEQMTIAEHVALYEQQGIQHKEAMRLAAKDRGGSKRDIYQALLEG